MGAASFPSAMDPELPKGQQMRQIFPDRGLSINCVPESRSSSLKEIKKEAELARGEEELKAKVEAAKWRSVEQGCNYDQYRQLCLGADLKGLPAGIIQNVRKEESQPINRRTRRRGTKGSANSTMKQLPLPTHPPADRDEFERHWRSVSNAECTTILKYLARFSPTLILKVFRTGVEEYLGSFVHSLHEGWDDDTAQASAIAGWLLTLPQTPRFDIAVSFLGDSEKAAVRALFERVLALEPGEGWTVEGMEEAQQAYQL